MSIAVAFFSTFFLLYTSTSVHSCATARQLGFERCTNSADCVALNDGILSAPHCSGRSYLDDKLTACPNATVDVCMCRHNLYVYCERNDDCIDEHYCGISANTGNKLCVGCTVLTDPDLSSTYRPVDKDDSLRHCYDQGRRHPPCGYDQDLCSRSMPCDSSYECLETQSDGILTTCAYESTSCRCLKRNLNSFNEAKLAACVVDDDCGKDREVCAEHVTRGRNYCTSCDHIQNSHDIRLLPDSMRCSNIEERPIPERYVEGPNGRTLSKCRTDVHCVGDAKCMKEHKIQFQNENKTSLMVDRCNNDAMELCTCRPSKKKRCKTGTDCLRGESCISAEDFNIKQQCASNAFMDINSMTNYEVIGNRTYTGSDGWKATGDSCKFDWECKNNRRCRHEADELSYGKCAGRRGCTCEPLVKPSCSSDTDCDTEENCVTSVGGIADPFCMSSKAMEISPFFFHLNESRLTTPALPTPIPNNTAGGLSDDPCLTTEDCVAPRHCFHRFDMPVLNIKNDTRCDGTVRDCICRIVGSNSNSCRTSSDCEDYGEICTATVDTSPDRRFCISKQAFDDMQARGIRTLLEFGHRTKNRIRPTPFPEDSKGGEDDKEPLPTIGGQPCVEPTDEPSVEQSEEGTVAPPCVDVALLAGFEKDELVYKGHIRAGVLCDMDGSCATPGHMVTYNNTAMSMRTYCGLVKCVRRTRLVNSPRMKGGLRVASRTARLEMTAFAARHETWFEENALRYLIHLGL